MKIPTLPIMNKALSIALRTNTDELIRVLLECDYPVFNWVPANGGWTPGQIAEHLLLFDIRVNTVLLGKTEPVKRDPQEKIGLIQDRLIDRENKIDAPAFLLPLEVAKIPAALIDKIVVERRKLNQSIEEIDLSLSYPDTPHWLFGILTGIEWVQLLIHHCNRHILQLKKLQR